MVRFDVSVSYFLSEVKNIVDTIFNKRAKIDHLFKVLKKCRSKFDCLIYEMLFIKDIKPSLNTQSDSIRAKLFTRHFRFFFLLFVCLILGIIPIGHPNIFIVSRRYIFSFQLLSF